MHSQSIVRNIQQDTGINDLRIFLDGITKVTKYNCLDLSRIALKLLRSLPATRCAIFEYLSNVFIELASKYIQEIGQQSVTTSENDEILLSEIYTIFLNLINENPTSWAPIISQWSLELLGEISTRFSVRRVRTPTNLNETLQLWMGCAATKILVEINTKCLASLIHSNTEACISALLDTSVKHSPHFDWVVAHVGGCFPNTVITRVLSCGLKDFAQNKSYEQSKDAPKLKSVVGILEHLSSSHGNDIRSAILEMFMWSLDIENPTEDSMKIQKKTTVPFILQLSLLSRTFFSAICANIKQYLTVEIVYKFFYYIDDWCRYFGSVETLQEIVINLILKCHSGGTQIINMLLDCVALGENVKNPNDLKMQISDKSLEMLQNILLKLDDVWRQPPQDGIMPFTDDTSLIYRNFLSSDRIRSQVAARIITLQNRDNPSILIDLLKIVLKNPTDIERLSMLVRILTDEFVERNDYFACVLEEITSRDLNEPDQEYLWNNLLILLKWEKNGRVPLLNGQISNAIRANVIEMSSLFEQPNPTLHTIAEIFDLLEIPPLNNENSCYTPSIRVILNLTQATVNYFFYCCRDDGTKKKIIGYKKCETLLMRLCIYSKVAKVLALRELIERALFRNDNVLFGAKPNTLFDDALNGRLLLKQNKKMSKTIPLTKHSSVFNGGVIGMGKRRIKTLENNVDDNEVIASNIAELITMIRACCRLPPSTNGEENRFTNISLESVTLVSLLLVQFVSPDVMYNGLPWPEEEFSKVTIERDLFIRRLFTNCPVLWDLLNFVAVHRPTLCYCSVLLRALIATLIHQWKSIGEPNAISKPENNFDTLMETTIKVIDVMTLGQLLPPPLSQIRDVLPKLKCLEIVAILRECIWFYMRDHIPSPALFIGDSNGIYWRDPAISRAPEIYTNTLRNIMQRNIVVLGPLYAQMFINSTK